MDGIVSKYYEMNPLTEDMLPDGSHLQNGMIVLIGDEMWRQVESNIDENDPRWHHLRKVNRWCEVTNVKLVRREPYQDADTVTFIGVYVDGIKCYRQHELKAPWLAKLTPGPEMWAMRENVEAIDTKKVVESMRKGFEITDAMSDDQADGDPDWVKRVEGQWQDEKGTSTT